ncbi:hypothetical protein [Shewanella sp. SR44-3]|uniref:hypothetical protein n=1 Tax=unclassified Shewanella TaxID=196818 RepID=UPI0015F9558F|nr:hypothetical protein [Shewanella sp. SR44-3]MBB1268904.1 hypothetical protein [Shewanella sp. SR44-3]
MNNPINKLFQAFKKDEVKSQFVDAAEANAASTYNPVTSEADTEVSAQTASSEPKKHSCCGGCGGGH